MASLAITVTASHFLLLLPSISLEDAFGLSRPAHQQHYPGGTGPCVLRLLCLMQCLQAPVCTWVSPLLGEVAFKSSAVQKADITYCFWAVEARIAHHMLSFLIKGLVSLTVTHVTPITLQWGCREEWDTTPIIHHWDANCKITKPKLVVKEINPCSNSKYLVIWWENMCDLCLCLEAFPSVKAFKGKPDLSFMLCSLDCGLQWCQKCTWSDCILSVSCRNDFES